MRGANERATLGYREMTASVTWMLPDKFGGVNNLIANLLAHRRPDELSYHAVLARNLADPDDPSDGDLQANVRRVEYSLPPENFYSVLRRLAAQVVPGRGVIVANDWLSLAMASAHRTGKSVVYINHGDYAHYYDLAVMHEPTIDLYIAFTDRIHQRLRELLPRRAKDIVCIPYGVSIPAPRPRTSDSAMRLLYVGRLDRSKGVLDLPPIDRLLRASGMETRWTILGPGPAEHELKSLWGEAPHVTWKGGVSVDRVEQEYFEHDVLVMPSRAEGLPVALLEGMASGCIPVVSDLPSGIPEIVENGVSGFRVAPGDISGFADAIMSIGADRDRLFAMGQEAAARIRSKYNIAERGPEYQQAIAAKAECEPRWSDRRVFTGSRLDRPWLPNLIVKGARSLRRGLGLMHRGASSPSSGGLD